MKFIMIIASLIFLSARQRLLAQDTIRWMPLAITTNFTTNLIFPYGIAQVDIGSRDILAKKFGPGGNVLLLKADKRAFPPTNLSVYTIDGKLYSYQVSYAEMVSSFNYFFRPDYRGSPAPEPVRLHLHIKASQGGIECKLTRLYVRDGLLWIDIEARNSSAVDFLPEGAHFIISDSRRLKRTVVQEESIQPLYSQAPLLLPGGGQARLCFGLVPRTLGKRKQLVIEWVEKNADRRVRLVIKAKRITCARRVY